MNIALKILSISLLLAANIGSAFADPGRRQEWREELRATPYQQISEQRETRRGERQKAEQSRGKDFNNAGAQDESRNKPGRMTPDERRALRRQINEAGRDIYTPSR